MERPPLDGKIVGTDLNGVVWQGQFTFKEGKWQFAWLDEHLNPVVELTAIKNTPQEAMNSVIELYIHYNNGEQTELVRKLISGLDDFFNDDGGVKVRHFLAL